MASVQYHNNFIILTLVFIHLFIQQTLIEYSYSLHYRREYHEIPTDAELTIQRDKKQQYTA